MPLDCKIRYKEPELVLFIYGYDDINKKDIERFTAFLYGHLYGNEQFKIFYDLRKVKDAKMKILKNLFSHISDIEELSIDKVLASSILINSIIVEKLLNLIFEFKPPLTPTRITTDITEACDFLNR